MTIYFSLLRLIYRLKDKLKFILYLPCCFFFLSLCLLHELLLSVSNEKLQLHKKKFLSQVYQLYNNAFVFFFLLLVLSTFVFGKLTRKNY